MAKLALRYGATAWQRGGVAAWRRGVAAVLQRWRNDSLLLLMLLLSSGVELFGPAHSTTNEDLF